MNTVLKTSLFAFIFILAASLTPSVFAANTNPASGAESFHFDTKSFQVYGKCKDLIEASLKDVDGVKEAHWDAKTQMLTVTYNPHALNLTSVKQKVADSGHDTDTLSASDESYDALSKKCRYKRPEARTSEPGR